LQVGGVKAFGEPVVDRRQQLTAFITLALLLPEASQAHSGPQLERLRLLAACHSKGLMKTGFHRFWGGGLLPQEFPPEAMQLCSIEPLSTPMSGRQRCGQGAQSLVRVSESAICFGQQGQLMRQFMRSPRGPGRPPGPDESASSLPRPVPVRPAPSLAASCHSQSVRKALLASQFYQGLKQRVGRLQLPAALMQPGRPKQGPRMA